MLNLFHSLKILPWRFLTSSENKTAVIDNETIETYIYFYQDLPLTKPPLL